MPLGEPGPLGAVAPALDYVRLGKRRDADGADWDLYKLFLHGGERHAEVFLRVRADRGAAALAEKATFYRVPLLVLLDAAVGHGRRIAPHKVLVVGPRTLALAVPSDWPVSRARAASRWATRATTASSSSRTSPCRRCRRRRRPSRSALGASGHGPTRFVESRRYGRDVAWAEYDFESDDDKAPGTRRPARARWLIASNGVVQALATFSYWVDDAVWAVPAWERMMAHLSLGLPGEHDRPGEGDMTRWTVLDPEADPETWRITPSAGRRSRRRT